MQLKPFLFSYYSKLDQVFGGYLLFNFGLYQVFMLILAYLMLTVWFNVQVSLYEAALISFSYFLQISWFVFVSVAVTLTVEEALTELRSIEERLKTVLGTYSNLLSFSTFVFQWRNKTFHKSRF